MKVFISWSGEKSRSAALALRNWLPDIIQAIEPWMSEHDIEAGARWNKELATQLEETKFGIVCVTRSNTEAPWLLFETGALAKTLSDSYVCPYLIDLAPVDIPFGPLTQFQAKRADQKETFELVSSINRVLKSDSLAEEKVSKSFKRWWPDLEAELSKLPEESPSSSNPRQVPEMVEEILGVVRALARRDLNRRNLTLPAGRKLTLPAGAEVQQSELLEAKGLGASIREFINQYPKGIRDSVLSQLPEISDEEADPGEEIPPEERA